MANILLLIAELRKFQYGVTDNLKVVNLMMTQSVSLEFMQWSIHAAKHR